MYYCVVHSSLWKNKFVKGRRQLVDIQMLVNGGCDCIKFMSKQTPVLVAVRTIKFFPQDGCGAKL